MDKLAIDLENERLKESWNCFSAEHLSGYLAIDEQDQRINAQSILTRALLIDTLWPAKFSSLIHEEMRFGLAMTWLLGRLKAGANRFELLDALQSGAPEIPPAIREAAAWLQTGACPLPDYMSETLMFRTPDQPESILFEPALNTFENLWLSRLAGLDARRIDVLEVACGSGNEFGAIADCGIAPHIAYSGFDISDKNIANARAAFPGVNFFEASVLNSAVPDASADCIFLHDVLGHLSLEAMEHAIVEIMRIARGEVWVHCHNAGDIPSHEDRPVDLYHRNRLSIAQLTASFEKSGAVSVDAIPVDAMLREKFGLQQDYSATSVTFLVRKQA